MKFTKTVSTYLDGAMTNRGYKFKAGAERHQNENAKVTYNACDDFYDGFNDIMLGEDGKLYAVAFDMTKEEYVPVIWQEVERI